MPLTLSSISASECLITGDERLVAWREQYRCTVPGHEFTPRYKTYKNIRDGLIRQGVEKDEAHRRAALKGWDGSWLPGMWLREHTAGWQLRCSRGLVPRVAADLETPFQLDAVAPSRVTGFLDAQPRVDELRDYQRDAVERVLFGGWGRVALATNAGKGAIIAMLAAFAERGGMNALICCDEVAVFGALVEELKSWARIAPALVKAGVSGIPTARVTLAMVPTLSRRLSGDDGDEWRTWLGRQHMLLLDEADKSLAPSWRACLKWAKHTTWRAGFSGSFPTDTLSDLKLDELIGPIVARVRNAELVTREISARPAIEGHRFASMAAKWPPEWWQLQGAERRTFVYERAVTQNVARHAFVASLIRPGAPTVVVVTRIDHGQQLAAAIPGAQFVDGSCSEAERDAMLDAFAAREVPVLVVTRIFDRGTNRLGHADDLIFAGGDGSATQVLQRIGRGLRRTNGKADLRLVDVLDVLDHPEGDKRGAAAAAYLRNAMRRRLEVYASEGFDVQFVRHA